MDSDLQRYLLAGERVLWQGRPVDGFILQASDMLMIPFSVLWTAIAVFWNASAWTTSAPLVFKLLGLPFLVVGAFLIFGRFWLDRRLRRGLRYYITNRRILIIRQTGQKGLVSLDIKNLPPVELNERPDGAGTIKFGVARATIGIPIHQVISSALDPQPQFLRIEKVRSVYEQIMKQAS